MGSRDRTSVVWCRGGCFEVVLGGTSSGGRSQSWGVECTAAASSGGRIKVVVVVVVVEIGGEVVSPAVSLSQWSHRRLWWWWLGVGGGVGARA